MKFFNLKREGELFPSLLIIILMFSVLFTSEISAQKEIRYYETPKKVQFGFFISPTIIPKPSVNKMYGNANLYTRHTIGFEAGLNARFHVSNRVSFNTGLVYGRLPESDGFEFKSGEFSSINGMDYSFIVNDYLIKYWYIPLNIETEINKTKKLKSTIFFGINVRDYQSGEIIHGAIRLGDSTKKEFQYYEFQLLFNDPYKIRLNYQIGSNFYIKMKNYNNLKVGILYNFSFNNIANGYYTFFKNTPEYTYGTYKMSGSYLSLNVGYYFAGKKIKTKDKKKVRLVSTYF